MNEYIYNVQCTYIYMYMCVHVCNMYTVCMYVCVIEYNKLDKGIISIAMSGSKVNHFGG